MKNSQPTEININNVDYYTQSTGYLHINKAFLLLYNGGEIGDLAETRKGCVARPSSGGLAAQARA
jgi:hypothetical protein